MFQYIEGESSEYTQSGYTEHPKLFELQEARAHLQNIDLQDWN